jgi:4-hydroxybenzoate polyprenyltransferase
VADVLAGFAIATGGFEQVAPLAALIAASIALYCAGMILNDVFDVEQDTRERPDRPIPSGLVPLGNARIAGFSLLVIGAIAGGAAGYLPGVEAAYPWRSGAVALAIVASVLLYDGVLKKTPIGPAFMALCRFFNLLLGASIAGVDTVEPARPWTLYFQNGELLAAAALATYVLGITLFARTEARDSKPLLLFSGFALMMAGIGLLYWYPDVLGRLPPKFMFAERWVWPALLVMLAVSVGRHAVTAMLDPEPRRVQMAVKFALLSIITFEAVVTLHAAGSNHAFGVFLLVAPAWLLGRWVYST